MAVATTMLPAIGTAAMRAANFSRTNDRQNLLAKSTFIGRRPLHRTFVNLSRPRGWGMSKSSLVNSILLIVWPCCHKMRCEVFWQTSAGDCQSCTGHPHYFISDFLPPDRAACWTSVQLDCRSGVWLTCACFGGVHRPGGTHARSRQGHQDDRRCGQPAQNPARRYHARRCYCDGIGDACSNGTGAAAAATCSRRRPGVNRTSSSSGATTSASRTSVPTPAA